ncbi:MAG: ATP synthase F1 subunit delta [Planctomycetes bacterium]|nr:ATP synthase F1 subunit delta [Planctomycetota bacterium]
MVDVKQPTVFDSEQKHLGDVYAKALLGATENAGVTEQVLDEFDALVGEVLDKLPKLEAALASPRVPEEAKLDMLDRAFAAKMSVTLLNFLKVVCEHRRFDCVRAMNRAAHVLRNELTGWVDVRITTVEPLTDELCERVTDRLEALLGKRVILVTEIDAELIGGLEVRVGDTVYDASVLGRLGRLREEAVDRTSQAIRQSLDRFETAE